jgi:thiamine-phosphate pyrophosphorylase
MKRIGRLHVLTDTVLQDRFSHLELARMAVEGGADVIQFRQKQGSTRDMIETARGMKRICEEGGAVFVVNDRVDVALASEAHGVHLGQDDFPIPLARDLLGPDCIIGGSAATPEEAWTCLEAGADYVGFGPVYPTSSKDDAGPVSGLDLLKEIVDTLSIPIVAIGGITAENAAAVMKAGAYGVAVISSVCCQEDPRKAAGEILDRIREAEDRRS